MTANSEQYTLQQTALLLLELCRVATRVRLSDRCVGELDHNDLMIYGSRILRKPSKGSPRVKHMLARRRHTRRGHDQLCYLLGLPESTLKRLLESWGGAEAASWLSEIVYSAVEHFETGGWYDMSVNDVLKHEIGRRLTLEAPADSL